MSVSVARAAAALGPPVSDQNMLLVRACSAGVGTIVKSSLLMMYPGAPNDRTQLPLQVLQAVAQQASADRFAAVATGSEGPPPDSPFADPMTSVLTHLLPRAAVELLASSLGARWEPTRRGAQELLLAVPERLDGLSSREDVELRVRLAVLTTHSPKEKEAEGGARTIHVLAQLAGRKAAAAAALQQARLSAGGTGLDRDALIATLSEARLPLVAHEAGRDAGAAYLETGEGKAVLEAAADACVRSKGGLDEARAVQALALYDLMWCIRRRTSALAAFLQQQLGPAGRVRRDVTDLPIGPGDRSKPSAADGGALRVPLPHGLLMAGRLLIGSLGFKAGATTAPSSACAGLWRPLLAMYAHVCARAFAVARVVVSGTEAIPVLPGASHDSAAVPAWVGVSEGDADASEALELDARGHVVLRDGDSPQVASGPGAAVEAGARGDDADGASSGGAQAAGVRGAEARDSGRSSSEAAGQLVSVSGWMVCKEATACLAGLVASVPFGGAGVPDDSALPTDATAMLSGGQSGAADGASGGSGKDGQVPGRILLARAVVRGIGDSLCRSLMVMHHMGAVKHAADALEVVVTEAAHVGREDPVMRATAWGWTDGLMETVSVRRRDSVLRRSGGLAAAVSAVARGESVAALRVRTRGGVSKAAAKAAGKDAKPGKGGGSEGPAGAREMTASMFRRLLPIARAREEERGDRAKSEPEGEAAGGAGVLEASEMVVTPDARIHALTLLHFLLADKATSRVAEGLVPECFAAATLGFRSSRWPVRNAALMLFASATARFCGGKASANDTWREDASGNTKGGAVQPANALFAASEELADLLHEELSLAVDLDKAVRPSLQPVLLLFSRLKPVKAALYIKTNAGARAKTEAGEQPPVWMERYAGCVRSVAALVAHPSELARRAATRALAAATPVDRLEGVTSAMQDLVLSAAGVASRIVRVSQQRNELCGGFMALRRLLRHMRSQGHARKCALHVEAWSGALVVAAHAAGAGHELTQALGELLGRQAVAGALAGRTAGGSAASAHGGAVGFSPMERLESMRMLRESMEIYRALGDNESASVAGACLIASGIAACDAAATTANQPGSSRIGLLPASGEWLGACAEVAASAELETAA